MIEFVVKEYSTNIDAKSYCSRKCIFNKVDFTVPDIVFRKREMSGCFAWAGSRSGRSFYENQNCNAISEY